MIGRFLSHYLRRLPPAVSALGAILVLASCASQGGQEPAAPAPKQGTDVAAVQPAPAQSTPATAPTPAAQPAPTPPPVDSVAIVKQFCGRISSVIQSSIRQDSTPADPMEVVRKVTSTIRDDMAQIALSRGTTCR